MVDVIPKLDAGVTPKELLEEEYLKVPVDIIEQKAVVKEPEEEQKPDMQELYAEETVDEVQEPQEAPEDTIDEAQEPQEAPEEAIEEAIEEVQESREVPEEAADGSKGQTACRAGRMFIRRLCTLWSVRTLYRKECRSF